ncbi:MAG: hypothetical protein MJ175_09085, partial [Clostridia bacterium]|nr:hypothetical protein [Clostridia bacterium]
LVQIAAATRTHDSLRLGISPRATLALAHAAQAWAAMQGRTFVLPDDVKAVAVPVLSHRVIVRAQSASRRMELAETIIGEILNTVPAPIG